MSKQSMQTRNSRPVHQIRIGMIRAAVWANPTEQGVRHSVTFERRYRDGEVWKSTHSYGRDDLPALAKVADEAHIWISITASHSATSPNLPQGNLSNVQTPAPSAPDQK